MRFFGPTRLPRLNEAAGVVFLLVGLLLLAALLSYQPGDPSWNTAAPSPAAQNRVGRVGACVSDLLLQSWGLAAYLLPVFLFALFWKWVRSRPVELPFLKAMGWAAILLSSCAALHLASWVRPYGGAITGGGVAGMLLADWLLASFNTAGTVIVLTGVLVISLYLVSAFSLARLHSWLEWPVSHCRGLRGHWREWRASRQQARRQRKPKRETAAGPAPPADKEDGNPPFDIEPEAPPPEEDIPIRTLEDLGPEQRVTEWRPPEPASPPHPAPEPAAKAPAPRRPVYRLPSTELLNEVPPRGGYDSQELKEIAVRIKAKFEEFHVLGSVVQINPGPVVTTFEFKPDAGIKVARIITLSEDLCLGLQAESILIERIPGKPTVGIEVPNSRREVISLRQILESEEFAASSSRLTVCLGKDINGRIKVASLESMPHLLIAGSTGSGKSVMLNSLIMSVLYKATPDEVRMILVDPKRVEMGIYEGIPHLLTPVITDAKKATNALRNAVLEMERRLKLLASQGVRNIDQFNKKIRQLQHKPRNLFDDEDAAGEVLEPLPYILIVIDELADLMMLERSSVEETVMRLSQMARAVGMHLVLATQRPSVDVITGVIKANLPSRISFRVATRVDSRTVLDTMGAEHLLGKGDMLFLPPATSRLVRVHGAYVSENEINRVVEFWKQQAVAEYDQTFLQAPPDDDGEMDADLDGEEDPLYEDAVRVVLEMGKASTSILQRRLRLGYGRAARILDMMQREGIIGPPDGSRPRDVLKRPDWLREVEESPR